MRRARMVRTMLAASTATLVALALFAGTAVAERYDPALSFRPADECRSRGTEGLLDVDVEPEYRDSRLASLAREYEEQLEQELLLFMGNRLGNSRNEFIERIRFHICPAVDQARSRLPNVSGTPIGRVCLAVLDCALHQFFGAPRGTCVTTVRLAERAMNALCPDNWRRSLGLSP